MRHFWTYLAASTSVGALSFVVTLLALTGSTFAKDDIWGPGNTFSNAQGGVLAPSAGGTAKVPKTAAWKAVCQNHFRDLPDRDRAKREEINRLFRDEPSREQQWRKYAAGRDDTGQGCAQTWPAEFSRPSVEAAVRSQDSMRDGSCREFAKTIPQVCVGYVTAALGSSSGRPDVYLITLSDQSKWTFSGDFQAGLRWACEKAIGDRRTDIKEIASAAVAAGAAAVEFGRPPSSRDIRKALARSDNPYKFRQVSDSPTFTPWCGVRG